MLFFKSLSSPRKVVVLLCQVDCVCVHHVQTGVHMSDEVFAIWKTGLRIHSLKVCSG